MRLTSSNEGNRKAARGQDIVQLEQWEFITAFGGGACEEADCGMKFSSDDNVCIIGGEAVS